MQPKPTAETVPFRPKRRRFIRPAPSCKCRNPHQQSPAYVEHNPLTWKRTSVKTPFRNHGFRPEARIPVWSRYGRKLRNLWTLAEAGPADRLSIADLRRHERSSVVTRGRSRQRMQCRSAPAGVGTGRWDRPLLGYRACINSGNQFDFADHLNGIFSTRDTPWRAQSS